jgi:hypothetical protein
VVHAEIYWLLSIKAWYVKSSNIDLRDLTMGSSRLTLLALLIFSVALFGCEGDDEDDDDSLGYSVNLSGTWEVSSKNVQDTCNPENENKTTDETVVILFSFSGLQVSCTFLLLTSHVPLKFTE